MTLRTHFQTMRKEFDCTIVKLCNRSFRIIRMIMKIAVNLEYEDEKKTLPLRQATFDFVAKMIICFK